MAEIKADPDAERTVLQARARQMGVEPKDMTDMRKEALGEPAGRAIYLMHSGDHAHRLWETYKGFTAAENQYARRYLGLSLHAKTAKIEMMPETFEARADDQPDLRSDEERDRHTVNRWMQWRGYIMRLPARQQTAIFDVAYGRAEPIDAGQLTPQGRRFVEAMGELAKVIEKK